MINLLNIVHVYELYAYMGFINVCMYAYIYECIYSFIFMSVCGLVIYHVQYMVFMHVNSCYFHLVLRSFVLFSFHLRSRDKLLLKQFFLKDHGSKD